MSERLRVELAGRGYDIVAGAGVLADAGREIALFTKRNRVFIVSDDNVARRHMATLTSSLDKAGVAHASAVLPPGEASKSFAMLEQLTGQMLEANLERGELVVAFGGGVIGDLAGFAAGILKRGLDYVQIPTTLLAQVDSSVGGKTAINHPLGKNMIGAFYQPQRVVVDLDTLATLPERELKAGLAEVIKYGPIADMDFLAWIEEHLDALLARDPAALLHAVRRSCEIKAQVVGADERESGLRAILNFGHTFGHAIEAGLGYGSWLHGEAVGCGMVMASTLSAEMGLAERALAVRLHRLIERAGLPVLAPPMPLPRWFELMRVDKKAAGGDIRYVVLDAPGSAAVRPAPQALVEQVILRHSQPA